MVCLQDHQSGIGRAPFLIRIGEVVEADTHPGSSVLDRTYSWDR